ncbi:hypothetical protein WT83_14115 [Burkholderia territorii]|uniref:Fis family transcriptional regulator n=2 Tax=Burkholderia territorii TaxID=1503055 RepID=A0A108ESX4_9BURK|nr:hypothetical protein WT83_14115 [Burkholderia territorii]
MDPIRARALSLEHHLALVALRTGQPSVDIIARLFNAIGAARFLHEAAHGQETPEQSRFEQAWRVLLECSNRMREGRPAAMNEADLVDLQKLVLLHDEQMATTPVHQLLAARHRLGHWLDQVAQFDWPSDDPATPIERCR